MKFSRLAFLFFPVSIQLLCSLTFVQSTEHVQLCFNNNLNHVFSTIINDTQTSSGFYNVSYGETPNQVNAIALCRGDLNPYVCRNCIQEAIDAFTESCDNHIVWLDDLCMLRYSNSSIFGKMELQPYRALVNGENVTDVTEFNRGLATLLDGLKTQAASGDSFRKFATGNVDVSNSQAIYALAQCSPDLSQGDCNDCLNNATDLLSKCCSGRQGGNVLTPSCNIRYDKELFYEPLVALPPSPFSDTPVLVGPPVWPPIRAPVGNAPVWPPVDAPIAKEPVSPPVYAPVSNAQISLPVYAPVGNAPVSSPVDAPSSVVTPGPTQFDQPYVASGEGNTNGGLQVLYTVVPLMILQCFVF